MIKVNLKRLKKHVKKRESIKIGNILTLKLKKMAHMLFINQFTPVTMKELVYILNRIKNLILVS